MPRGLAVVMTALLLAACGGPLGSPSPAASGLQPVGSSSPTASGGQLTLLTHDSFAVSDDVLARFQQASGLDLRVLRAGDAGTMVNQAILTRTAPLADVLYGIDNTFLSRALDAGIFVAYQSPELADVPAELQLDPEHRVTPIDYGDVCINYDRTAFGGAGQPAPPRTLDDLIDPAYRDMLVVQNPATSSPGLAFLLATIVRYGDSGDHSWRDYWRALRDNGVKVDAGWEDAYYTDFSGGSGAGDRPLVVSYNSSPAAEVYFASPQPDTAPTAVMADGCFRQVEFAGVLAGTTEVSAAHELIDFMLSTDFQQDMPLQMFVYPANSTARLPDVFTANAKPISDPLTMDPRAIAAGRDEWINEWTDIVLH
jgi:thiamine transport system substrate-binding protein